jgi:hypothetical protein
MDRPVYRFFRFQTGSAMFMPVRQQAGFYAWPDRMYGRFPVRPVRSDFDNLAYHDKHLCYKLQIKLFIQTWH